MAAEGSSVLEAAQSAGIQIPHLCYLPGIETQTSCLVCVVRVNGSQRLLPSCATKVYEGMVVESSSPAVRKARRTALELLLAEHASECFAPCSQVCPAKLDISEMMRQVREKDMAGAIATARDALVLPGTLGYVCPGLCEKGCRRGAADEAVSICSLHRYAAEVDLAADVHWLPTLAPASGKRVAVVGAGPAGLALAYELAKAGHRCTVFDKHTQAGGTLRYGLEPGKLPAKVLDDEIALLSKMGIEWDLGKQIGEGMTVSSLRERFDAVAITSMVGPLAVPAEAGVFLSASADSARPHAVQAVADGKDLARQIEAYLRGDRYAAAKRFAVRLGVMSEKEMKVFMAGGSDTPRVRKSDNATLSDKEALCESERCMLCGCSSTDFCKLRQYATEYGAEPSRYRGDRRPMTRNTSHPEIVFEEGKCISCGLCVAIARKAGEPFGLTFVNRGFTITVAAPLSKQWSEALTSAAAEAVAACPTGAIHRRER